MDPLTAILLIGIMTVAGVKTAGAAVNDGIASARGHTPPTQERWRANEEKRRERGEKPRKDPGGIRRIWQNQMSYAAEKSAYKHQGRMEYLHNHGDDIASGKRERMERADRRRQAVGGALARAGGTSWDALRSAASKTAQATRRRSDVDTTRTDAPETPEIPTGEDHRGADATVLPFQRQPQDTSTKQDDIVRRWREALASGESNTRITSAEEWNSLPSHVRDQLIEEGCQAGMRPTVAYPNGEKGEINPDGTADTNTRSRGSGQRGGGSGSRSGGARPVQPESSPDPEHDFVRDPDRPGHTVSVAELQRRRREQARQRQRQHEAEQAQAEREHAERMAGVRDNDAENEQEQPSENAGEHEPDTDPDGNDSTNTEGASMTQHSGEITNLSDALDYVRSASEYCEQLYSQFETSLSQAHTAADDIGDESGGMETAISALNGFDLTNEAGRLSGVQEHYNVIVQAMNDVETAISAAREALSAAKSDLDESAEEFQAQTGISEQMSSHDEVANDTGFYVNA